MSPRERIADCLHHLEHVLPSQASIRDFVHHNTLHGFQHLPFPEALAAAQRLTGARVWLPEATYRDWYRDGRIDASDLDAAMSLVCNRAAIDLDAVLARVGERTVTRREVIRLGLLHALTPVPLARFRWLVEESGVLRQEAERWLACLDVLGIDHAFEHPESLLELSAREEKNLVSRFGAQEVFLERTAALWDELRQKVGAGGTAGELIKDLTDESVLDVVRPMLLRHLGAFLDQGLAPWTNPARPQGFYAAWRASTQIDIGWDLDNLDGVRAAVASLPADALDTLVAELTRLGLPEERWGGYLERLALELPGWSGMFLWRHLRPGYAETADVPVDMLDYLAVRLVLERIVITDIVQRHWHIDATLPALGAYFRQHPAELWVRHAYHAGDLPEYLLDLVEPHMPAVGDTALPQPPVCGTGWPNVSMPGATRRRPSRPPATA